MCLKCLKINVKRDDIKRTAVIIAAFSALWAVPRFTGGEICEFTYSECFADKLPSQIFVDITSLFYFLCAGITLSVGIKSLEGKDEAIRRELIRSLFLTVSAAVLMMFWWPFLSAYPNVTLALSVSAGALFMNLTALKCAAFHKKLSAVTAVNIIFTAYILYISFVYRLIA